MKQIIRSVLALTLCALLALASPLALVAEGMESLFAQVVFTLPDGSQAAVPVTAVTTTLGDTVYWVDQSMMLPEESAALAAGQLVVTNEQGEIVRQIPLEGALMTDIPAQVFDPLDPGFTMTLVLGSTGAPATPAEADERLYPFGFMTPGPVEEPTPEPTEEPTPEPTEEPTPEPTEEPTPEPTEEPTPEPTEEPTPEPTEEPTPEPTEEPTPEPTEEPTPEPTEEPTAEPTEEPTPEPTEEPTPEPTEEPTPEPTEEPTPEPTEEPTPEPTEEPTVEPTEEPTLEPTAEPTPEPTEEPTPLPEVTTPEYVSAVFEGVNLVDDSLSPLMTIGAGELLTVTGYAYDSTGTVWFAATDYRTNVSGYVRSDQVAEISEQTAQEWMARIDAELNPTEEPTEEPTLEPTEEPTAEPTEEPTEEPTQEPTEEPTQEPTAEPTLEPTEEPTAEPTVEPTPVPVWEYALTNNQKGTTNILRESKGGSEVANFPNGTLIHIGAMETDAEGRAWYPATVVTTGQSGFMRDYLLTPISNEDAQKLLDAMVTPVPETPQPEESEQPEEPEPTERPALSFPVWGITLEQSNGAMIVLRGEPGGGLPTSGEVPKITEPTPVEIHGEQDDANGERWYDVTNLSTGDTGYIEAAKVRLVSQDEALAAVVTPRPTIAPPDPTPEPTQTPEPEPTPEPTEEPTPTPEPEEPQPMAAGDVYHYGRTNAAQVNVRKEPKRSAGVQGTLESGTVLWVMERTEGDEESAWCKVRAGKIEGYMLAKFIDLMGVHEEEAYRATLADPEFAPDATPTPEPTQEPTEEPTLEPTQEPTEEPTSEPTAEPTATPTAEPTATPTAEPTAEPTQEPTSEPTAEPTATPTAEPTATPIPTATPAPQELRVYARVNNDGTPLRGNPSAEAYLQTILSKDEVVYTYQTMIAEDGMTWYLVQYAGQWGYVRADLVRLMGEAETAEYLAALEAELATPTPMPQATPEPVGPNSTSAYAKLIRDSVNLRRTPSASGTSLGRIPVNTLLLVVGSEYDGTYTWYQVNYNGQDGYVRSDMAQMMTIAELQAYLAEQASTTPKPGVSTTPNKNNNTSHIINGSPLQDLIPVDNSWTNNVISGMPSYATATPDPNATPTPVPPETSAALISGSGELSVQNVPSVTKDGTFTVYGKAKPSAQIKAIVNLTAEPTASPSPTPQLIGLVGAMGIRGAVAEGETQTMQRTVGTAVADANGNFTMDVTLPMAGEYIVEFSTDDGAFARYGVTYDTGATPEPTAQPLPTAEPIEEDGGMGAMPFVIAGVLIVIAAAVYGVYIYRRKTEEAEEEDEDEDEEAELREEQLAQQRMRRAEQAASAAPTAPRMPQNQMGQVPAYMKNTEKPVTPRTSPYEKPAAPANPAKPVIPTAPAAPVAPVAPVAPTAPKAPTRPVAPKAPAAPVAPVAPTKPVAPAAPTAPAAQDGAGEAKPAARRRRRPPVDPNA